VVDRSGIYGGDKNHTICLRCTGTNSWIKVLCYTCRTPIDEVLKFNILTYFDLSRRTYMFALELVVNPFRLLAELVVLENP
jgi:hypothetical protein